MRKFLIIFLLIYLIQIVSAQEEINFFKSSYSPGETAQLEIKFDLNLVLDINNLQLEIKDNNQKLP